MGRRLTLSRVTNVAFVLVVGSATQIHALVKYLESIQVTKATSLEK